MAEEETQTQTEPQSQPSGSDRERKATQYHVLIDRQGALVPVTDGDDIAVFEGRRSDVLDEVVSGDFGVRKEGDKSEWVYIIPARGFHRLRATVKTITKTEVEEG